MSKDSWWKGIAVWAAVIVLILFSFQIFNKQRPVEKELKYNDFVAAIQQNEEASENKILEVTIRTDPLRGNDISALLKDNSVIRTYAPANDILGKELRDRLETKAIPYTFEKPEEGALWTSVLSMWLPLILLGGFMLLFLRNMQGAGGKALSFGKSKARLLPENQNRITFKDVAGVEEAKQECSEIIDFLKDHKKFHDIGARIPKGVLLMGPPGTGKTLLARAIAGEAGVPFFHISGSDFVEMFVGVGASRVRDLFEQAKKNAPCIVFIDEIDAVGRHRGAGVGGGHDEREQTLNQLLVDMDGFEPNEAVIVVAATNRPDVLDPALLRPGRFDRRVVVNLPDVRGRKEIVAVHTKKVKTTEDVNVEKIALGTPGFSGADLANLVNEAALNAARYDRKKITMKDFETAKDKILMGPERKSMMMSKENKTSTAYHETGHALVSYYLKSRSDVHKVTIIPRGRALGVTAFLPKEDLYSSSRDDMLTQIAVAMGGRAAEELKYGQFTTGASNDIQQATSMARAMVTQYGMSEKLGPISFSSKSESVFLGRDGPGGGPREYSEEVAKEIDNEVSIMLNKQYDTAKQILLNNMNVFERVAQALVELETLDSDEFLALIGGSSIEEIRIIQAHKEHGSKPDGNPPPVAARPETPASVPVTTNPSPA